MDREEWIAFLRERNIPEQLSHGPVCVMLRRRGKLTPARISRKGQWICITTGKVFHRRIRLPIEQIEG